MEPSKTSFLGRVFNWLASHRERRNKERRKRLRDERIRLADQGIRSFIALMVEDRVEHHSADYGHLILESTGAPIGAWKIEFTRYEQPDAGKSYENC